MKPICFFLFLFLCSYVYAQNTSPIINANFGADAELIPNFRKDTVIASDDWFTDGTISNITGAGTFIIDTTGAAAMAANFAIDPELRKSSFSRSMRFAPYSLLSNRMLIDGFFMRDNHGLDSTSFTISGNKNGMNPVSWNTPVAQLMPDVNDIEDVFVHVRRAWPTSGTELWLFGGVTIVGTAGNRFFDFELYQTDISYDHANGTFINNGPEEGHTSWFFDAQGNVVKSGDIIFTVEYSTTAITLLEARIWVNKNDLSITPAAFDWKLNQGNVIYDGATAGSQYVYAAIKPKTSGSFYSGVQSTGTTWAGPFKFLDASNNVQDNYTSGELMEFSVNLTKLGLDSTTLWGMNACNFPFKKVLVKSRTSTSFSSELKDFVGPYPLSSVPRVDALAESPMLCTQNDISKINVLNPYVSSIYTWSTPDGNIESATSPTSVFVNEPGMYIVSQQLGNRCGPYAKDTITVLQDVGCTVLDIKDIHLQAWLKDGKPLLQWTSVINDKTRYYEVQRSVDDKSFQTIYSMKNSNPDATRQSYTYWDKLTPQEAAEVSYRIKATMYNGEFTSSSFSLSLSQSARLSVYPNPAYQNVHLSVFSGKEQSAELSIVSASGHIIYRQSHLLKPGVNTYTLNRNSIWTPGLYIVRITSPDTTQWQKLVIQNNKP